MTMYFDIFKNRLELMGTLTTITALRISQGRSNEPIGSDLPVVKDTLGQPLIPGSSFKGALRSRLESFLRGIDATLAANPAIESEWAVPYQAIKDQQDNVVRKGLVTLKEEAEQKFKGTAAESAKDKWLTAQLIEKTDFASRFFGSPWLASKFQVRDLNVMSDTWFGQYQERDGVSIDRDTETAANGRLYDFQVVPAGVQFDFRAVVENAEAWELGLLIIGLQQFKMQQIPLGGGISRGLGIVELDIDKALWVDPAGQPAELLKYMQRLGQGDLTHYQYSDERFDELKTQWTTALVSYLSNSSQTPAVANISEENHA